MKRKNTSEKIKKIDHSFEEKYLDLRRMIKRWVEDNTEALQNVVPITPETGNDRATDNWQPLLAIADCIGGEWREKARTAMIAIEQVSDNATIKQMLLTDIQEIFDTDGIEKISSKELVGALSDIEDHPWNEWRNGKPITQNGLAHLLKPFGIFSKTIRLGDSTCKGYVRAEFQDAFERYVKNEIPHTLPIQTVTTTHLPPVKDLQGFQSVTLEGDVTVANRLKSPSAKECDGVTVQNGQKEGMNNLLPKMADGFIPEAEVNDLPEIEGEKWEY